MSDREEKSRHLPDEIHYVPQMKVRTHLRGGADYPDMSGVCNDASTTPPTSGGGYVNGVYYPDKSGVCGTGTLPPTTTPPTAGGGYVNGVFYPDKSGICV
jgi:hypothetical protein